MSKPVQIFLCHASEDKPKVVEVYRFLLQQGFKPWLDKEDLLPGQRWDQEIPKALKASDFVLIFFSQKSTTKRGYVQREFKLALEVLDEIPEGQIFVIPVRLDECEIPERFHLLHYCDLFDAGGPDKVVRAIRAGLQSSSPAQTARHAAATNLRQPSATSPSSVSRPVSVSRVSDTGVVLRSKPVASLSSDAVKAMLKERGFFDISWNKQCRGLQHQYESIERNGAPLVIDHATGLMWQQGGSEYRMHFANAQKYIERRNHEKFAGYSDWRLPTLDEAMSLLESETKNGGLYIDPVFDSTQSWIWTADKESAAMAWSVSFYDGSCDTDAKNIYTRYVRAVRSGQS